MKHSLIQFGKPAYWQCAICGMSEEEAWETPECSGVYQTAYQRTKQRKQSSTDAMNSKQAEMENFIDRLFR